MVSFFLDERVFSAFAMQFICFYRTFLFACFHETIFPIHFHWSSVNISCFVALRSEVLVFARVYIYLIFPHTATSFRRFTDF